MTGSIRLGDVVALARDETPVSPSAEYRTAGLLNRGRGIFERPPIAGGETKYTKLFRLREGQLVYSKLFGWEGSVAVVTEAFAGCFVSAEFPTFDADDSRIDRRYLAHVIRWDGFVEQLAGATTGMGQRRQRVNIEQFKDIVIPLPELDEQRRIANYFDGLVHLSRCLDNALPDRTGLLLDSIFDQFTWETDLSELLELDVDEFEVDPSTVYSQAGVYGKGRGMFLRGELLGAETKYRSLRRVTAGQVVLSRLKAFEGAVAIVPNELTGSVLSQEFPSFSLRKGVEPGFVRGLIGRHRFTEAMQSGSTGVGARRERLSVDGFLKIRVPLPAAVIQVKVGGLVRTRQGLDEALSRRTRLKDALLPAARNEVFSAMV